MKYHRSWGSRPSVVRMRLAYGATLKDIRSEAFSVIDRMQHLPADKQLLAVFAAGAVMANAIGKDPHELLAQVRRMIRYDRIESQADAVADYAKGELA